MEKLKRRSRRMGLYQVNEKTKGNKGIHTIYGEKIGNAPVPGATLAEKWSK